MSDKIEELIRRFDVAVYNDRTDERESIKAALLSEYRRMESELNDMQQELLETQETCRCLGKTAENQAALYIAEREAHRWIQVQEGEQPVDLKKWHLEIFNGQLYKTPLPAAPESEK
jgi:hypothetical protein